MNRRLFLGLSSAWAFGASCLPACAKPAGGLAWHHEPRTIPSLAFQNAEGQEVVLVAFKGRAVLLNFWASWCLPCLTELPSLDRLQENADARRLVVLAASLDVKGMPAAKAAFLRMEIRNLGLLLDAGRAAASLLNIPYLPATLLIDPQGREAGRFLGAADWNSPAARTLLDDLFEGRQPIKGSTIPLAPLPEVAP